MTLMACYGAPPSSCYETIALPDGGRTTDFVCDAPDPRRLDGGTSTDAGSRPDGGAQDAGTTDGGVDAGP
jgi:hypothetical protein